MITNNKNMNDDGLSDVVSENVRARMERKKFTIKDLADASGAASGSIYNLLSAKTGGPTLATLERVAHGLDCAVIDLLEPYDPEHDPSPTAELYRAAIRMLTGDSGAGQGSTDLGVPRRWLHTKLGVTTEAIAYIEIAGHAMAPTLVEGDIVVATTDPSRLDPRTPGVFLLEHGPNIVAARIQMNPGHDQAQVSYDDPRFTSYEQPVSALPILARVLGVLDIRPA